MVLKIKRVCFVEKFVEEELLVFSVSYLLGYLAQLQKPNQIKLVRFFILLPQEIIQGVFVSFSLLLVFSALNFLSLVEALHSFDLKHVISNLEE